MDPAISLNIAKILNGKKICIVDKHELLSYLQPNVKELHF